MSVASVNCHGKVWTSIARDLDDFSFKRCSLTSAGGVQLPMLRLHPQVPEESGGIRELPNWLNDCVDAFVHLL